MQNVAAEFSIGQRPTINAEFSIEESNAINTIFTIKASPTKVSQLENDLGYQTEEEVNQAIETTTDVINERIDDIVETFDGDIEEINNEINTINENITEINSSIDIIEEEIADINTELDTKLTDVQATGVIQATKINTVINLKSVNFVFEQGIASDTWEIEHNLGKKPSITVVDSADSVIGIFKADYDGENKVTLKFNGAFTGKAYLN